MPFQPRHLLKQINFINFYIRKPDLEARTCRLQVPHVIESSLLQSRVHKLEQVSYDFVALQPSRRYQDLFASFVGPDDNKSAASFQQA